jgi:hypothetical protein
MAQVSELTKEQRAFLEQCEEENKFRYTEKDPEFLELKKQPLSKPPIVENWPNSCSKCGFIQESVGKKMLRGKAMKRQNPTTRFCSSHFGISGISSKINKMEIR